MGRFADGCRPGSFRRRTGKDYQMARKNRVSVYDGIYHITSRIANRAATRLSEGETLYDACVAANAAAAQSVAIRYVLPSLPRRG